MNFEINDGPAIRLINVGILVIILAVASAIAWMIVTRVDEVAKVRGALEPVREVQRIQTEYGGALASIAVEKGAIVEVGGLIAEFDSEEAVLLLREARAKEMALLLEQVRLGALVNGGTPNFAGVARSFTEPEEQVDQAALPHAATRPVSSVRDIAEREQAALEARRAFLANERSLIDRQTAQKTADLAAIASERPAVEEQLKAASDAATTLEGLVQRGLSPRPSLIAAIQERAKYNYDLASLNGREAVLKAEIEELEKAKDRVGLNERADARARMSEIDAELSALYEQIVRLVRRLNSTKVTAPVAGYVQTIPDTVVGRVVEPGGLVAEIVPRDVALRFAGQLPPRDVGFVSTGQPVRLKVDAFDFSRFGALDGAVAEVSPTTIVDERGTAFYEVLVSLDRSHFGDNPEAFAVLPGMTGEADIVTGQKTIFEYVWKPIYTNLDLAFTER